MVKEETCTKRDFRINENLFLNGKVYSCYICLLRYRSVHISHQRIESINGEGL